MGLQRRGRAGLSLGAAEIAGLCAEIRPLLKGARVAAVRPLPPADVVLVCESERDRATIRVRISADPDAPRLHVQHARVEWHAGPLGPFFRRLADDLTGSVITDVAAVRGDRIVIVEMRESPVGERRALLAELVGRHSNLVLLGPADRVIDVLVAAPRDDRNARLALGGTWSPPPGRAPSAGDANPARSSSEQADASSEPPPPSPIPAPLSWTVERALGGQADEARRERARSRLLERTARKLSRARSLVSGLERRLEASDQHERVRLDGELLKANMHLLRRGLAEIEVADHFVDEGPMRRIALDPKRSPQDNLTHIFDRAKKLERARTTVASELELARTRLRDLEELERAAHAVDCDPERLDADAVARGWLDAPQEADERKRKTPAPRLPYRSFRAVRGSEIRVGRNARDNDDLTFHHARGNDAWLHTSDAPGSHVVLCLEGAAEPDSEELLDAAHLAVHFSPLRESRRASVHVARRKDVHKPRGAKAGLVTLSGGRILHLRLQPERTARLLGDRRRSEGADEDA
jgi:predicted ribosome quality control (RQC) complex YloA/Tae2 family protein